VVSHICQLFFLLPSFTTSELQYGGSKVMGGTKKFRLVTKNFIRSVFLYNVLLNRSSKDQNIFEGFFIVNTNILFNMRCSLGYVLEPKMIRLLASDPKMLSVRMEHTVWRKITYGSLRGPLSNPLYQNTRGKIFIFHFILSSKFEHISDIYPNAPTHSNLHVHFVWIYFPK